MYLVGSVPENFAAIKSATQRGVMVIAPCSFAHLSSKSASSSLARPLMTQWPISPLPSSSSCRARIPRRKAAKLEMSMWTRSTDGAFARAGLRPHARLTFDLVPATRHQGSLLDSQQAHVIGNIVTLHLPVRAASDAIPKMEWPERSQRSPRPAVESNPKGPPAI